MSIKEMIKNAIPDLLFIKMYYEKRMGERLDYKDPVTFNQKLQWMKAYDHNPLYTRLVDKYRVKDYVRSLIGEEYVIPTLGVWNSFGEIDFNMLPSQFVLKCTHDSGSTVICRDKKTFDMLRAQEKIEDHLSHSFYKKFREWPYKNVKARVIAEPLLCENNTDHIAFEDSIFAQNPGYNELEKDECTVLFEIYCSEGTVSCYRYRKESGYSRYYSKDSKPIGNNHVEVNEANLIFDDAAVLNKMFGAAEKIAESHDYMKIEFFLKDNKIYFGKISIPHALAKSTDNYVRRLREWLCVEEGDLSESLLLNLFPHSDKEANIIEAITDYKFFCFGGVVDNVMIVEDRQSGVPKFFHFSKDWELLKYNRMGRLLPDNAMVRKPHNMNKMIELAEILSKGLPEVRIDLYEVNGQIYFGEYTFFHHGGYEDGFDYKTNKHMGDLIVLPKK